MQFQTFLDPFGTALQQAGMRLNNEAKSIQNATSLYKLGMAQEQFKDMMDATGETARAFREAGTATEPGTPAAAFAETKNNGLPSDPVNETLQRQTAMYKFNLDMARIKRFSPQESIKYSEDAAKALKDIQGTLKEKQDRDQKRTIDLSKMFLAGADSPAAFGDALKAFMYQHPNFDPSVLGSKFGFQMGPGGVPMWDPNKLKTLGNMMLTAKDKLTIQHNQEMEKLTAQLRAVEERRVAVLERGITAREAELRDRGVAIGEEKPKVASEGAAPKGGNKNLTGDEYLATLNPSRQSLVKGIAEGRIDPRTLSYRDRTQILSDVTRYKPGYQQFKYPVYAATLKDFSSPQGMAGRNIVAINTAIGHAGTLFELGTALDNHDTLAVNAVVNKVAHETGDPRINNFQVAAAALSSEMMRVFRQVGASEKEQKEWEDKFGNIQSPAQMKGAVETAVALLHSRINALDDQWKRAMDTDKGYPNMISKHSAQVLDEVGKLDIPSEKASVNKDKPMTLDEYLKAHGGQ